MNHSVNAGHFCRQALARQQFKVTKPLDDHILNEVVTSIGGERQGNLIQIDEHTVILKEGYLTCPWKSPHVNKSIVAFIRRLHAATDCVVFEHLVQGEIHADSLD